MAKLALKAGTTSEIVRLFLQDATSSTGAGLTGLVFNSSGLTAYYIRQGAATAAAITLVTATVGTWTSGGFKEVDATNLPGVYELHLPNAAIAASAASVLVMLKGATNLIPTLLELELDAVDYQDTVRFGLTALPNVAAGANGGLPTGNASGQVAVASVATAAITAAAIAADAIGASELAADAAAEIATAVRTELTTELGRINATVSSRAATGAAMTLDFTQAVPTSNTAQTVGDALNAARAQGFGKWVISGTTLTLYASDGTTVVRTFTLNDAIAPTART